MKKISQWATALTLIGFLSFGWQSNTHRHADAHPHSSCVICHVTGETATVGNVTPSVEPVTQTEVQASFALLPASTSIVFDLTGRSPPTVN